MKVLLDSFRLNGHTRVSSTELKTSTNDPVQHNNKDDMKVLLNSF